MDTLRDVGQPLRTLGQAVGAALVLLLVAVVFITMIPGSFQNYLQGRLGPWLLASAVAMGALPLWTPLDATDKLAGLERDTHGHDSPKVAALLLLPVLLSAVSAPASLGAGAVSSMAAKPKSTISDTIEFPPPPTDSATEMSMQDFEDRYAFGDLRLLAGRSMRLPGFVAEQSTLPGGQWSVNRFRIYCCVADASLFTVPVEGVAKPEGGDVWAEAEGAVDLDANREHPVLTASKVKVIRQPEDPYL